MITLRIITQEDIAQYRYWQLAHHKYHSLNGPYFKKKSEEQIDQMVAKISQEISSGKLNPTPKKKIISNEKNELLGEVSWYWKSEETKWLEIGIVIFDDKNWGKGIGKKALKLWIEELFDTMQEIVRLGLTSWSGNKGMLHLAERIGMKKEAVYRKARIVNGQYFDSVSYGILREEWNQINTQESSLPK